MTFEKTHKLVYFKLSKSDGLCALADTGRKFRVGGKFFFRKNKMVLSTKFN